MNRQRQTRIGLVLLTVLLLAGCASTPKPKAAAEKVPASAAAQSEATQAQPVAASDAGRTADRPRIRDHIGSGEMVSGERLEAYWNAPSRGRITLNFANTDLREVVKVVLGDILRRNYTIDPAVKGRVTVRTVRALDRDALLAVLESVLQMNGAALVENRGVYKVMPLVNALRDASPLVVGEDLPSTVSGFAMQILPLKYTSAEEMLKILEPLVAKGASVRAQPRRNVLIMAAPRNNLEQMLEVVRAFDVDYLAGLSFAIVPLEYADAGTLISELNRLFQKQANADGVVSFEAVERLNAVLVLSKQPSYIQHAKQLIADLDQGGDSPSRSLHVYGLKYSKAEQIAEVLKEIFAEQGRPAQVSAAPASKSESDKAAPATNVGAQQATAVTIIADKANNAIVIMANLADYRVVASAIDKLDRPPKQVHIEATIAEVTLTDNLQHGVQWFMKGQSGSYDTQALLSSSSASTLSSSVVPGFSFSGTDASGDVRLLFDMLSNESKLKILSSPQLLVIDNQTANIRVGDQIPIITRQTSGSSDPDAPLVNEVQFRDTGVLLQVTPRINDGGMVTLEVSQEVSEPSADEFAAGNVSILQRSIQSAIAVQDGETAVLGGLIRESNTNSVSGVPFLSDLPLIGFLFKRTVKSKVRTELVVTLTPRVIENANDRDEVVRELEKRLQNARELLGETRL